MLTLEEFAEGVKYLRILQKRYFRSKSPVTLAACKEQEKRVDEMVVQILGQPELI